MQALRNLKNRMKEEGLVIKAEEVTNMAKNDKKTRMKILRLCDLCEKTENAHVIFSVFRARINDGIAFGRHLSLIKTIWLMDTLARFGHTNMVEFIASALPYVEGVAQFYGTHSEVVDAEAFEPVFKKACGLADYLRVESPKRKQEESRSSKRIEDAVDEYLVAIEDVVADVEVRLAIKVQKGGRAIDSELVSPTNSVAGSTPAASFSTAMR